MLILRANRPDMAPAARGLFFGGGPLVNATVAAVITDAVYPRIVVYDRGVVGVMDFRDIDVIHRAVVVKAVVVPAAAFITAAEIAVAVIYAAVKTNPWAPITFMENKDSSAPTPIGRSPDIALLRADGLLIDGQRRRRIADGNADVDLSV